MVSDLWQSGASDDVKAWHTGRVSAAWFGVTDAAPPGVAFHN